MKPYPIVAQSPRALEMIEKLAFKDAELTNSKDGYISFIEKYPASPLRKVAEEKLRKLN